MDQAQTTNKPKRRRYCQNIWQAQDRNDMQEFRRHLKKMIEAGTLSTPWPNSVGHTILHSCTTNPEMFGELIDAGANPNVKNGAGQDVIAYARRVRMWGEDDQAFADRVDGLVANIAKHEAAKLAAALTASTPAAEPAETRKSGRL